MRRYLKLGFEKQVTPADVPDPLVHREYQRRLAYLNHDTYADVWHILVPRAEGRDAPRKRRRRAHVRDALATRAKGMTLAEFQKLGRDEGLTTEEVVTRAQRLGRAAVLRGGVRRSSVSRATRRRATSRPRTGTTCSTSSNGSRRCTRRSPRRRRAFARPSSPSIEKHAFGKLVEEAMGRHHVELHPEHLPQ